MSAVATQPSIDDRDWSKLTFGERLRQLEVEGYVVLPDLLSPEQLEKLREETAKLKTVPRDYSDKQQGCGDIQFAGGAITELNGHPPTIAFLEQVFGDEPVVMSYGYGRSDPGHPGISLHTDGQPYGSKIFGFNHSCPVLIRVLYYLDDLTPDVSPFRVVPRSHLSLHAEADPYQRYESHPEEVIVTLKAGSAVLINYKVFHGNFPNTGNRSRRLMAIAYRPAWAGPTGDVETWDPEDVAKVPPAIRRFFKDRNERNVDINVGNKPPGMKSEAPGISPSRWSLP